ncbi:MAG: hypothetical protein ACRDEB_02310 [Chitinophagaceae bacterium]
MTWNSIMGFISTLALFLPIFFILVLRLGSYRSFPMLLIYFTTVFVYSLMKENYINADANVVYFWGISNNLLDAPLMLLFLSYFSPSQKFTRRLIILILLFIAYEISVILITGFTLKAITFILGPGVIIVFALSLNLFVRLSKIAIINQKALGKTLIVASQVFAYGCYGILYVLFYIIQTKLVADVFLIYFIVVTFSSAALCTGIIVEKRRIQKLFELKKARKELHTIYKDSKPTRQFRTPMLDFDRDLWN